MLILGISTTTKTGSIALYDEVKGLLSEITVDIEKTHSELAVAYFKEHYSQLGYQVEIKPDIGNIKDIEISKSKDFAIRESHGKWILYVDNICLSKSLAFLLDKSYSGFIIKLQHDFHCFIFTTV